MDEISNSKRYLERMSKPLQEKLKLAKFIPAEAKKFLDVGCADGTVTIALAEMFPQIQFVGIDINKEFIDLAKKNADGVKNITFENIYLREKLVQNEKFDVVMFCSVLHEFFSYGEGISTVVKALSDAHEILNRGGILIIRDMILFDFMNSSNLWIEQIKTKIKNKIELTDLVANFEIIYGEMVSTKQVNHFLLKYLYEDNWQREAQENYVPVSFEEYERIFGLLGMKEQYRESYTIPYLMELWTRDFGFSADELACFRSTGIIVAKK